MVDIYWKLIFHISRIAWCKTTSLRNKRSSKVAPALATGAASALGEIGINKLFGKEITIPKKIPPNVTPFAREFTKSQRDQINKAYQTGGRLVVKPARKQIEGGFLGTLALIGIPIAISLVSKMFVSRPSCSKALNSGLNLTRVSLSRVQKHFFG